MKNYADILKIRESTFYNKNVKEDIKIASIGDIHISQLVGIKDINNISEVLYKMKPDYICMLGDLVDTTDVLIDDKKVKELETLIKNSSSIAPTMIILGSHDFIDEKIEGFPDVIKKTDVWNKLNEINNTYLLNDELYKDNRIVIGGYRQKREVYYNLINENKEDADAYYDDFKKRENLYKELPQELPKVLLTHSPESITNPKVQELLRDYNVIITGHYHNGCVPAILDDLYPSNAGIITPRKKIFPTKARGVVKLENGSLLIYSGGWTKIAACTPKIIHKLDKLCNRQLDLMTLTSNEEYRNGEIHNKKVLLKK